MDYLFLSKANFQFLGFPRGIEKVLNCGSGFQDLEKGFG